MHIVDKKYLDKYKIWIQFDSFKHIGKKDFLFIQIRVSHRFNDFKLGQNVFVIGSQVEGDF